MLCSELEQNPKESVPDSNSVQNQFTSGSESKTEQRGGTDNQEKSISLVTPNYGNKRRRPASKITKKGKKVVSQARRVPRRHGRMSVKINEDGSEECSSDDKANEEETEKGEGNTECYGMVGRENYGFDQNPVIDVELSHRAKTVELEAAENASHDSAKLDKLAVTVDPVQAMLLNMIPSLGKKYVETKNSVTDQKPSADNNGKSPVVADDKLSDDVIAPPVKKKKVSYKDVAGELLKDW